MSLVSLPQEIVEQILSFNFLSHKDVCNFSTTCKTMRQVCDSNELWHRKFRQRWPELIPLYEKNNTLFWYQEFVECFTCGAALFRKVAEMSSVYYRQDEMSRDAFVPFSTISKHHFAYHFCVSRLERILNGGNGEENLTHKYYAYRVLRHLKHTFLKMQWELYLTLPQDEQLLEKGSVLLTQWCQTSEPISEHSIAEEFCNLAKQVQEKIKLSHPKHPIVAKEIKSPNNMLKESLWSPEDCRIILLNINDVLFQQNKFTGNRDDYYNASNSYINEVLDKKTGIPITLCLVYAAVAIRLGVVCQPVNFPGHFILKWKEFPYLLPEQQYSFIDVFEGGKFMSKENCTNLIPGQYNPTASSYGSATPVQVFHRMCWNLVEVGRQRERVGDGIMFLQNILELLTVLRPEGVEHKLLLARVYLHLNINLEEVISILEEIEEHDPASRGIVNYMHRAAQSQIEAINTKQKRPMITPKLRSKHKNVEYSVGMLMTHKKFNYTCVIFGWDPKCAASRDWIFQMGVYNLPNKDEQPFYNVLVEDGSNRYAAQENLAIAMHPKAFNHTEIGKYFQHFRTTHYVPNNEKANEYPEDELARDKLIARAYSNAQDFTQ